MIDTIPEDIRSIKSEELYEAYETGSINTPPAQNFNTPAMDGSLQQFLSDNLGSYVVVEFLVGTGSLVQKAGILYATGSSILTLYEDISQTFVTCDIYSVKFVTFYLPGHRPWEMTNPLFAQSGVGGPSYIQGRPLSAAAHSPNMGGQQTVPTGPVFSGQFTMSQTGTPRSGMEQLAGSAAPREGSGGQTPTQPQTEPLRSYSRG